MSYPPQGTTTPADIATHAALTTGLHGVGADYLAKTKTSQKYAFGAEGLQSLVNLLENGDFEVGDPPTGWGLSGCTLAQEGAIVKIGSKSLKIHTPTAAFKYAKQHFTTTRYQGRKVTLGGWVYCPSGNVEDQKVYIADDDGGFGASDNIPKDDAWHWVTATMTSGAASTEIRPRFYISWSGFNAGDELYVDGAILVEGDSCPAFSPMPAGYKTEKEFIVNAFQYPSPGTDWTPALTGAVLVANKAAKKCWLPLNFLKIGDIIESYKLVGDIHEEGGDTNTLDCKLVRVNKANPLTTTDVAGGGITQVVADGNFDSLATLTTQETVATDKQYLLEILGTTSNVSGNEFIKVITAEVKIYRLG